MLKTIVSFFFFAAIIYAQTHTIEGLVFDFETGEPLSYANVRIDETTSGTSANRNGRFTLKLKSGKCRLIFSFIGYKADTLSLIIPSSQKIEIGLEPQAVKLPEVVVSAEDPAFSIIREAIKRKKENRRGLTNFEYNAYSKRIILSADEVAVIEETFVKGYNKINEWEKEFILSTHKTENRKKDLYTMDFSIAEDYYIDFTADTLELIQNLVYLPLYENAFDYYDYKLLKIIEAEDHLVYLIKVIPLSQIQPLLEGEITIESNNYALNSVNLQTNEGVRFPYINDFKVEFVEQIGKYQGYWLPHYVEAKARLSVNVGGLITIEPMSFNQISSITEYNINKSIPDSVVNAVRSSYGYFTADTSGEGVKSPELSREEITNQRPIPLTGTEVEAYASLDSTKTIEKMIKVGGALSAFIPEPDEEEEDTTTSFIGHTTEALFKYGYFRDNRVTGIVLGAKYDGNFFTDRLNMNVSAGYSLHREKLEGRLSLNYEIEDFFLDEVETGVYQYSKMWQIFTPHPDILNSVSVLIGFEDQFNYYLSTGYNIAIGKNFGESFFTKLSFISEQQDSLPAHKYQSIFGSNRSVRENPNIIEGKDNRLSLFAEWGKNPMEIQPFPQSGLIAQIHFSDEAFGSDFNYQRYRAIGMVKTKTFYKELFVAPYLQFTVDAGLITGTYGPQHIFTPNTALAFYSPPGVFKGLKPYEFVGTEMIAMHLEHNWRTVPFQAVGLDFITDLHIDLITGVSGLRMWNKSEYLNEYSMAKPYWEVYLGISRIFAFIRLDFAYSSLDKFAVRAAIAVFF
jgi:hypothetical protein